MLLPIGNTIPKINNYLERWNYYKHKTQDCVHLFGFILEDNQVSLQVILTSEASSNQIKSFKNKEGYNFVPLFLQSPNNIDEQQDRGMTTQI